MIGGTMIAGMMVGETGIDTTTVESGTGMRGIRLLTDDEQPDRRCTRGSYSACFINTSSEERINVKGL
jgi:hypothetical protein